MFDGYTPGGALGRDLITEEVRQMARVLARVILDVQTAPPDAVELRLEQGVQDALGRTLGSLRTLPREELLAVTLADGHELRSTERLALADVLALDSDPGSRRCALWLYEAALAEGAPAVPFGFFERLDSLRETD